MILCDLNVSAARSPELRLSCFSELDPVINSVFVKFFLHEALFSTPSCRSSRPNGISPEEFELQNKLHSRLSLEVLVSCAVFLLTERNTVKVAVCTVSPIRVDDCMV